MREIEPVAGLDELAEAVLSLRDRDEARRFLRDLRNSATIESR